MGDTGNTIPVRKGDSSGTSVRTEASQLLLLLSTTFTTLRFSLLTAAKWDFILSALAGIYFSAIEEYRN